MNQFTNEDLDTLYGSYGPIGMRTKKVKLTKDELIIILSDFQEKKYRELNPEICRVYKKLCDLIDNYCEHEFQYEDLDHTSMRCNKCFEITE
jgi:hypothetical protein